MPVVTFTICALLPFFTNTTLASFSRSSFCACFSRRSLLSSALLSSLSRAATFCFCFSISSGLRLVSAGANRHALHRHCDGILNHVGLDIRGATQSRA